MKLAIVTEGPLNAGLLERLVSRHPGLRGDEIRVMEKDSHYGFHSRAHTVQTRRRVPVAAVMNTDSEAEAPSLQR